MEKSKNVVILIHGTFAREAEWTKSESTLSKAISNIFEGNVNIQRFNWSGNNSHDARIKAGKQLAKYISTLCSANPNTKCHIVAHSHGGNVAMLALKNKIAAGFVDKIACLATPFIHCRPRGIKRPIRLLQIVFVIAMLYLSFIVAGTMMWSASEAGGARISPIFIIALSIAALVFVRLPALGRRLLEKQKEILESLSLPPTVIPVMRAKINWDEAGLWLRLVHLVSELPHWMWVTKFKWLFVFLFAFAICYTEWDKDYWLFNKTTFLIYLGLMAGLGIYLLWMLTSQLLMMLVPRFTRSHPAGFGWEGILTPWLVEVSAQTTPPNCKTWTSLDCQPPEQGLRHSWVYEDEVCINAVANWLAEPPCSQH